MVLNKILLEMMITKHVMVTTKREAGEGRLTKNYASEEAVLCSHYAQLCMGFYLLPKGWAKPLVVNWQSMAACSCKSFNK